MFEMSQYEYLYRTSLQILATSDEDGCNATGWGSGFVLEYKEHFFFITAAHVLWNKVHEGASERYTISYPQIASYAKGVINGSLCGKFLHLPEIYITGNADVELMKYCIEEKLDITESIDHNDIAFCEVKESDVLGLCCTPCNIGNILQISKNETKIPIEESKINISAIQYPCVVQGIITAHSIGDVMIGGEYAYRQNLKFSSFANDGNVILSYSEDYSESKWSGLSGSPIFDSNYTLVGVLLRVNEELRQLTIVSIKKVLEKLDYLINSVYRTSS